MFVEEVEDVDLLFWSHIFMWGWGWSWSHSVVGSVMGCMRRRVGSLLKSIRIIEEGSGEGTGIISKIMHLIGILLGVWAWEILN